MRKILREGTAGGMRRRMLVLGVAAVAIAPLAALAEPVGVTAAHDPSTVIKEGSVYYYFVTGQGIGSRTSTDKINWSAGPNVFNAPPAWTTQEVAGFTGDFWAPDVAYFGGSYHLYYSASSWGSIDSGIGVATSPTLANATWTDQGKVVQSDAAGFTDANTDTTAYNAIDPSIMVDNATNRVWMSWGSYSSGIMVSEISSTTGKRIGSTVGTQVANNSGNRGWGSSIEGSSLVKHGSFYYLFVNYGGCCSGIDSTYNIRVGRSTSPTGPFLDQNGADMRDGGGTLFLDDDGHRIGPGHFSIYSDGSGQDQFGYHYYNGDANGAPAFGMSDLYWTADSWPSVGAVNPTWSGAGSLNWSNAANWSGGLVPNGVANIANFRNGTSGHTLVSIDGGAKTVSRMNFNSALGFVIGANGGNGITLDAMALDPAATINVAAGSHTIAAPITAIDDLGINIVKASSTLSLSGGVTGLDLFKYGDGAVAFAGGTSAFSQRILVHNGNVTVSAGSVAATQYVSVGVGAGDVASLTVRGTGAFTANNDLNIGDTGASALVADGTLTIADTASVTVGTAGGLFIASGFANNSGSTGTLNQTGGSLTVNTGFDGGFVIGGRTSSLATGNYNLSGGTVTANTNLQVGGHGTGTITQTGGTFTATGFVSIGRWNTGVGNWTLSNGGTLSATNAADLVIVGESGTGTLDVNNGGIVLANGGLRLALSSGGKGTVHLNAGGTITAATIARGTGGTALFTFNGGTLRATSDQTDFFRLTPADSEIAAGGAILDSAAHAVTITKPLDGVGGLTKIGAGTLTFTVDQSFTGGVHASGGTLAVTRLINNGSVSVDNGATLRLAAPTTPFDPAHRSVINGTLTLAGGSNLSIDRNAVVIDYTGSSATPLASLRTALASGLIHGGTANASTVIGYADASALTSVPAAFGTVDASSILMRATLAGDATLDGSTTFDDLLALARNYGTTANASWSAGDFDYNGTVDFSDLLALAHTYGTTAAATDATTTNNLTADGTLAPAFASEWALAESLAPEPTLAALAAAGMVVLARRRGEARERGA